MYGRLIKFFLGFLEEKCNENGPAKQRTLNGLEQRWSTSNSTLNINSPIL
jgi:hypothetical protein